MTVAAIDIGTNSTRLLIVDDAGRAIERRSEITRLGGGLAATGCLNADGIDRTLAVLRDYRAAIDERNVHRWRVVGTQATRQARDADPFIEAASAVIGQDVEVLTPTEEGHLTFVGATADLEPEQAPFLVIDIGGGSTELAAGTPDSEALDIVSIALGCVSVTDAILASDPPRPEELSNAIATATDALADACRQTPALTRARTLVGVAGTITTVAAVELGLARYDRDRVHGMTLTRDAVEDVFRTLATEPLAVRVHNPGLPRARADVIVGGCCILVAVLRNLGAAALRVSDADLLDAVALALR